MSVLSLAGLDQLEARLDGLAARIRADLGAVLGAGAAQIADLAGSQFGSALTVEADAAGVAIGSDLPYARLREMGFQGSESVKAYLREIRQVFGRPVTPHPIAVRSFSRTVDVPARPFLAPALAAVAPDLMDAATAAVAGAIQS